MKIHAHPSFIIWFCLLTLAAVGCGKSESVHPTTALTEEQKAAIKAEDDKVAQEESYGTYNKKPKKR